jgi:hypothetical protein
MSRTPYVLLQAIFSLLCLPIAVTAIIRGGDIFVISSVALAGFATIAALANVISYQRGGKDSTRTEEASEG